MPRRGSAPFFTIETIENLAQNTFFDVKYQWWLINKNALAVAASLIAFVFMKE